MYENCLICLVDKSGNLSGCGGTQCSFGTTGIEPAVRIPDSLREITAFYDLSQCFLLQPDVTLQSIVMLVEHGLYDIDDQLVIKITPIYQHACRDQQKLNHK